MTQPLLFKTVCIIGIGLIGGSLAYAIKRAGIAERIIGCSNDPDENLRALELGMVDSVEIDPAIAVTGADLVVIAVPLGTFATVFRSIAPQLSGKTLITDVGSAKGSVITQVRQHLSEHLSRFVPGHPIAGTERNGVDAGFAELYDNHRVLLTPIEETSVNALEKISALWEACGATVEVLDVNNHDQVLAATSHLPHMLAYSLVDCLLTMEDSRDVFRYAAGGFEDFTRIASSSPQMWNDIVFANKPAVLEALDAFVRHLQRLREAIDVEDTEAVLSCFDRSKSARDRFVSRRQEQLDNEHGEC